MITAQEYYIEVESFTKSLVLEALQECDNDSEQALELINDSMLHEWIDSHEWIIYYRFHLPILQHSDNAEYMIDHIYDDASIILKEKGLSGLHCALAYWAMYGDIMDILQDTIDNVIDSIEQE